MHRSSDAPCPEVDHVRPTRAEPGHHHQVSVRRNPSPTQLACTGRERWLAQRDAEIPLWRAQRVQPTPADDEESVTGEEEISGTRPVSFPEHFSVNHGEQAHPPRRIAVRQAAAVIRYRADWVAHCDVGCEGDWRLLFSPRKQLTLEDDNRR